jgi:hypothetical protein
VRSAECEPKRFHARVGKLDLELSIDYGLRLTYQLVQALFGHVAVALLVNVDSVRFAGRLSVNQHSKSDVAACRKSMVRSVLRLPTPQLMIAFCVPAMPKRIL